ncbi:MAG: hypothetical protein K2P84_10795 [Undibacterium sp.]|nr:hypothetical protein [Undibacterium sp.]
MRGAGGTTGGSGQFLLGLIMMCGGFYMLLSAISVNANFGFRSSLYGLSLFGSTVGVTSGMIMIPMIIGIGMIFFNAKNYLGWFISLGSLAALIFGVISSIQFQLRPMNAFDLIVILVLAFGGLGLFLRSLRAAQVEGE